MCPYVEATMAAYHGNRCGRAFVSLLRWIETKNSTLKGFAGRCRCYRIETLRTLSEWMIRNIEQNPNPRSYIMTKEEVNFNRQMPASHQWILKTEGASRAQISHPGSQWWRTNYVRRQNAWLKETLLLVCKQNWMTVLWLVQCGLV